MKHLTTLLAILMCGSLLAQSEFCGVGTVWDAESQTCIVAENVELLDSNLDGVVGVEDLLNLLSHFGDEDMDFDGIYDSVDDCVGTYDECGVCNGPGPQILGIDTIIVYYDSLYAEAIDEWWVFEVDADTLLTYLCENPGCTDPAADNYDPYAAEDDGSCYGITGCMDFSACNFHALATIASSCVYPVGCESCSGETDGTGTTVMNDADDDGVCDWDEVLGCQDPTACNYNSDATDAGTCDYPDGICEMCSGQTDGTGTVVDHDADDDGVCDDEEVWGCQDPTACNYWSAATDSGACLFATGCDVCTGHPTNGTGGVIDNDADDDGICDWDEVLGCQHADACNYDADATDAGNCVYATACQECSGETDGTGVVISFDVTFDGYTYDLVAIGDQCWFAENLRTEHYANGDAIPGELSNSDWYETSIGAQAIYNNDDSFLSTYGRLYNWHAVDDLRGLCPSGWHVPTDGEYMILEMALGMSEADANSGNWRGTDQGTQMKSSPSDDPSWNGTNTSGFSALAGGLRYSGGSFNFEGNRGYFWSSSLHVAIAWSRSLYIENAEVGRYDYGPRWGFSVRCLKDAE